MVDAQYGVPRKVLSSIPAAHSMTVLPVCASKVCSSSRTSRYPRTQLVYIAFVAALMKYIAALSKYCLFLQGPGPGQAKAE